MPPKAASLSLGTRNTAGPSPSSQKSPTARSTGLGSAQSNSPSSVLSPRLNEPLGRVSLSSCVEPRIKGLPAFLQQTRAELQNKFTDLEWHQRHRIIQSHYSDDPAGEWSRAAGDDVALRNRYHNIDPWLNNRVKLKVPEGHSDYINASPIILHETDSGHTRRYVATQGPKDNSLSHLWRMVWDETETTAVIVMLTQTYEAGREKCFQYYPLDAKHSTVQVNADDEFGDGFRATVELVQSTYDTATRSTIRQLRLTKGSESKTVWHFLFGGWPDFLVPEDQDRLALIELIKSSTLKNTDANNARIVHCSAGVGRSGTFIALDYLLSELDRGVFDNFPDDQDPIMVTVDSLRRQRMMMVQGESQYLLLYDILREQWLERRQRLSTGTAL